MTAHTPGPWKAADTACWFRGQQHPDHGKITVTAGENGVVANCYGRANARLIAAAPELLDALEKAELHLAAIGTPRDAQGRYHKDGEWTFGEALPRDADAREVSAAFALVRAAIAKTKGEQP